MLMSYRLPRLRLARPGIAGHRTPLQAEAPGARRHPGLPGYHTPAPYCNLARPTPTERQQIGRIYLPQSAAADAAAGAFSLE